MRKKYYLFKINVSIAVFAMLTLSTAFLFPVLGTEKADANAVKTVYFTFDDGPSAVTEELLDILKEENIPATFFIIGPPGAPTEERILRIVAEGHAIGLHSMSHNYDKIYTSTENYFADLAEESAWIYSVTGIEPKIFRYPGGSANSHTPQWMKEEMAAKAEKLGLTPFDWNADASDSLGEILSPEQIAANVLSSEAIGSNTVIVLMHDSSMQKTAPEALRVLIQEFRDRGYVFGKLK